MTYTLNFSSLADKTLQEVVPSLTLNGKFQLVTGLHKLVNSLNFLLLTEKGSVRGWPDYGLETQSRLGRISLSETAEVRRIVSEIAASATSQLQDMTDGLPDEERLGELSLENTSLIPPDGILITVSITSVAGQSATYDMTLFKDESL